jgi:hypothetical protein
MLEKYAEAGVSGVVISLPSRGRGDALRALDHYAPLVEDFSAQATSHDSLPKLDQPPVVLKEPSS